MLGRYTLVRAPAGGQEESNSHHHNNNNNDIDANPYFRFDDESKHIEDSVFNCRAIIINERFWNRIRTELLDLARESGPIIMYQLGLNYGWDVGNQAKSLTKDTVTAVRFLEYYGLLAGWGRFEAPELEKNGERSTIKPVAVKVFNNFFAQAAKIETGNPGCFFLSGLIAGVLDGLIGGRHNCLERHCIGAGSERCEFVVARMT